MEAYNCTADNLRLAARSVGLELSRLQENGKKYTFKLRRTKDTTEYVKVNPISRRKSGNICFHGHYAFFRELFDIQPTAVIKSSWYGAVTYTAETLQEEAQELGMRRLGPPGNVYHDYQIRESCLCLDDDPNPEGIY